MTDLGLVQIYGLAADLLHRHVEAHARAERRLFEQKGQRLTRQKGLAAAVPLEAECGPQDHTYLIGI